MTDHIIKSVRDQAAAIRSATDIEEADAIAGTIDFGDEVGWDTHLAEIEALLKTVDASGVGVFVPISTEGGTKRGDALKFLKAVLDADPDECVIWPYKRAGNYAYIQIGGKEWVASRLVAALVHGLQPHQKACHASRAVCRSKLCITPKHIRPDTQLENMADRHEDGTITETQDRSYSKEDAISIFYAVGTRREIAETFGVSRSVVGSIKRGTSLYSPVRYAEALFADLDATFGRGPFSQSDAEDAGLLHPQVPVQLHAFIGHTVGGHWRLESETDCTEPHHDAENCVDFVLIDLTLELKPRRSLWRRLLYLSYACSPKAEIAFHALLLLAGFKLLAG